MNAPLRITAVGFACAILFTSAPAWAQTAASADDICAPATDPCVVASHFDVTGDLDFGLRTVRITNGARLTGLPNVRISCGEFVIDTGFTNTPVIEVDGANYGDAGIRVFRACSGDGTTQCFSDSVCTVGGLGTCSVGTGTAYVDGKISGSGAYPGDGYVQAAGDIFIGQKFHFGAGAAASDGGSVDIESYGGSVTTADQLIAKSGQGGSYGYYGGEAGEVSVRASLDITIGGTIDVWGRLGGGRATVNAGRDVTLTADIVSRGGGGGNANGGYVYVTAGRDISINAAVGGKPLQEIDTDGGTDFYFYGYGGGGSWYSGYGGYQYLTAGADIAVGGTGRLHAQGGRGAGGGRIYLDASGRVDVDGEIRAQGTAPSQGGDSGAAGGYIELVAGQGIRLGTASIIATASLVHGGGINVLSPGPIEVLGLVDVRGTGGGSAYSYSSGGYARFSGAADMTLAGSIRGSGVEGGDDLTIDVCRLTVESSGRMQNSNNPPGNGPGDNRIIIHESMTAKKKSNIIADAVGGGRNLITYRDPQKPPTLDGNVSPDPVLAINPALVGCPVCGNEEIDQGESCDDGNTASGDGCRNDCQDEGCIAESPGFPSVPLCDDADACTVDACDPVGHTCLNVISCEEGVACTVDSCVAGGCDHTPVDALCDDRNDCTTDICNSTTGCVYADLTGGGCEDGDFCTVTGSCDDGECLVTDASHSARNKVRVKIAAGAANDSMKTRAEIPLTDLSANPALTGVRILVFDEVDDPIYDAVMGAADWEDLGGKGSSFRFRDTQGLGGPANGTYSAKMKRIDSKGIAKISVRMKGGEIPGAADQQTLSVALLFGIDPLADDCVTARRVPCKSTESKASCKD